MVIYSKIFSLTLVNAADHAQESYCQSVPEDILDIKYIMIF